MIVFYKSLVSHYILFTLTTVYLVNSDNSVKSGKGNSNSIVDDDKCGQVRRICNNLSSNDDLLILECLLASNANKLENINEACQDTIWDHARILIEDNNVKNLLRPVCEQELEQLKCNNIESGHYLKCVLSNIRDIQNQQCNQMLLRLENVAFTDYHFIVDFLQHCSDDISTLKCGRFDPHNFSQTETINCLQNHILSVKDECKKEVFRLSELQANSIMFDTQLYVNCASDHLRYCSQFVVGNGRIIPCLIHVLHSDPLRIDPKCRQNLLRREKLIAQDFRVSKGLIKACKEDIKKTHCRQKISSDKTVRLAQILLCLENVVKNGTRIDSECEAEMIDHRKMLMEDYRLSPEIVNSCKNETVVYCKGYEYGGKTIHCLMNLAVNSANSVSPKLSQSCMRALEDLVKQTDAGENWSVDPVLHQACDPVVKVACKGVSSGNARIMSCLMDNLHSETMTEECENALIEIQYFVSRDFNLDPQLYRACKQDATKLCHNFDGADSLEGPSYSRQVLPCLYRHAYLSEDDLKLQKVCLQQIQRVMRQRAQRVDLQPEIEEVCVRDLGAFCHDKLEKGEEMQCLQDNLDDLEDKCHDAVDAFTEIEAGHVELNPYISKFCKKIISTICSAEISNDEVDIMDCLIANKNNPVVKSNPTCRVSIEHFQIISLKDIKFTYKFKVACKAQAMRLCQNRAKTKTDVIACLSEHILNATVLGVKSSIPKDCRQALKAQIFQQREKIDYNPSLKKACTLDIRKFCGDIQPGDSQILECLQMVPNKNLSPKCGMEIFNIQKMEVYDNTVDYALHTMCAETIDQFCSHHDKETIFYCLKLNRNKKGFSKKCGMIVMHRILEQNSNNLLNPSLLQNCQLDIKKFCKNELGTRDEKQVGDSILKCLKAEFKTSKLTNTCEKEVAEILKDRTLDVNLNPNIQRACKNELETICKFEDEDTGKVEECLKVSFVHKNIVSADCKQEVANVIQESQSDIQVDPFLQQSCNWDLITYCSHVEQGNGRHIQCLRKVLEGTTQTLSENCKTKLKERLEMYKTVAEVLPLANLGELYKQVTFSPAKNYFVIVLLMMVGGIFFVGVFCGRISRKKYRLLKNK